MFSAGQDKDKDTDVDQNQDEERNDNAYVMDDIHIESNVMNGKGVILI